MSPSIVVDGRFLTQRLSGVQRYARSVVSSLAGIRDDLQIVCPANVGVEEFAGIPLYRLGKLTGHAWEQFTLPRYLARLDSALLLCLGNSAPLFYNDTMLTVHDVTFLRYPSGYPVMMRWGLRLATPLLVRRAQSLITVSEFSKAEIVETYGIDPEQVSVVANAVDGQLFYPEQDSEIANGKVSFFLGYWHHGTNKNSGILIDAFRKMPEERLVLVGEPPARVGELPSNVLFRGHVSDDQLRQLYQKCCAFIAPSLYEGFGLPVIEAQACGAPVIAADQAGAFHEVLGDSTIYFDGCSADSLVERVESFSRTASAQNRQDLVDRGLANVARWSWDRSASVLSELLDVQLRRLK